MTDKLVERLTPDSLKSEGVTQVLVNKGTAAEEIQQHLEETLK